MALFDRFKQTPEKKAETMQIAAEKRQMDMMKDQMTFSAATNPEEDHSFAAYQEARSDFLKWQQDLAEDLRDLVTDLRGVKRQEDGTLLRIRDKPLCNDNFIYEVVIPQCKPFFSKNLINSNLDEERILLMLKNTANTISDAMADSWNIHSSNYGIEFNDFDLVVNTIKNAIIPAPYRALKGWTKKIDNSAVRRIEAFTERSGEEPKKGLLNFFK